MNYATGYVVKLIYDDADVEPRWVIAVGRKLGTRSSATVYSGQMAADAEASLWRALSPAAFSVVVELSIA